MAGKLGHARSARAGGQKMRPPNDRASRRIIVSTLVAGVILGGVAFAYKIAEFIHTLSSPDFAGTFDVGITVYFFICGGWLCLLGLWLMNGKFKKMEGSTDDMLRLEEGMYGRGTRPGHSGKRSYVRY